MTKKIISAQIKVNINETKGGPGTGMVLDQGAYDMELVENLLRVVAKPQHGNADRTKGAWIIPLAEVAWMRVE